MCRKFCRREEKRERGISPVRRVRERGCTNQFSNEREENRFDLEERESVPDTGSRASDEGEDMGEGDFEFLGGLGDVAEPSFRPVGGRREKPSVNAFFEL